EKESGVPGECPRWLLDGPQSGGSDGAAPPIPTQPRYTPSGGFSRLSHQANVSDSQRMSPKGNIPFAVCAISAVIFGSAVRAYCPAPAAASHSKVITPPKRLSTSPAPGILLRSFR